MHLQHRHWHNCAPAAVHHKVLALKQAKTEQHAVQCVLDELIKPDLPVLDYITQFSGITPAQLAPVTTTLPDVHARLRGLLTPATILVGHALDNDLKALRFLHGRAIDTVHLYPHPAGLPRRSALRVLAQKCAPPAAACLRAFVRAACMY